MITGKRRERSGFEGETRFHPLNFISFHEKTGRLFIYKSLIRGHHKVKTTLNYSYRDSRGSENGLFWDVITCDYG